MYSSSVRERMCRSRSVRGNGCSTSFVGPAEGIFKHDVVSIDSPLDTLSLTLSPGCRRQATSTCLGRGVSFSLLSVPVDDGPSGPGSWRRRFFGLCLLFPASAAVSRFFEEQLQATIFWQGDSSLDWACASIQDSRNNSIKFEPSSTDIVCRFWPCCDPRSQQK
jgi:hypothetical protein